MSADCGGSIDPSKTDFNKFNYAKLIYDNKGILIDNETIISININKLGMKYFIE